MKWSSQPFEIPSKILEAWEEIGKKGEAIEKNWEESLKKKDPKIKSELEKISKLPSREILIGQLISMLNQPLIKFINVSQAIPRSLVNVLNNLKDKK